MNTTWTLQDVIFRAVGEMFITNQLTEEEQERGDYPRRIGLTPEYIQRALVALRVKRSELTDMISGDLDAFIGVNRCQERRDFFARLHALQEEME